MFFVPYVSNISSCLLYKIHQPCVLLSPFLLILMVPAYMIFLHHCANRDEWEKYPFCNGSAHTRTLQCDEHNRLRSHHLTILISYLFAAFWNGAAYSWGLPPVALHPGQSLRGQQQCLEPQHWSCQVPSVPQTFTR